MTNNLTLISASYNTPYVTETMLKSFTNLHSNIDILISENSTNNETEIILKNNKIPFIRNQGGLHAPSVDLLIDNVKTDYVLLVDTDVIFIKNISPVFNQFLEMDLTLMGEIVGDRGGKRLHRRVNPWYCFINVKNIKSHNIKFYDEKRMRSRDSIRYDVGSSFFEDIRNKKLRIGDFRGDNFYYKHYEGMSWRVNKFKSNGMDGDIDNNSEDTYNNIGLYQYGKHVDEVYLKETQIYKSMKIVY